MMKWIRGFADLCGVAPAVVLAWLSLVQFAVVLGTVLVSLNFLSGEVHQRYTTDFVVATVAGPVSPAPVHTAKKD